MSFTILMRAQSYGPGHDLWIIPRDEESLLIRKMDWYVNFQISRAAQFKTRELSSDLKAILQEFELPPESPITTNTSPLLLHAEPYLPTKKLVELSVPKDSRQWIKSAHKIWENLGQPSLRVFLPSSLSADAFGSSWPGGAVEEISLVPHTKI